MWAGQMGLVKIPSEISGAVWTVGHPQPAREVIYYRDPTGKPNYSLTPKSTVDGQPYGPVYASEEKGFGSGDNEVVAAPEPKMDRKIKFYRNPMGLA